MAKLSTYNRPIDESSAMVVAIFGTFLDSIRATGAKKIEFSGNRSKVLLMC